MKTYDLTLRAISDVSPGANRERGFLTPSLPYIPGSAIRGALAALWIATRGDPSGSADFDRQVRSLRAGPAIVEGSRQRPLSVLVCRSEPSHVLDSAFEETDRSRQCPHCGGLMERSKGEWEIAPSIRRDTRTALDEDQTVAEGQLFSRESLASGQTLVATATGDLDWLGDQPARVRLGGRRSTQGLVELSAAPATVAPQTLKPGTFALRLISPGVFVDEAGRNRLEPQPGDLARAGIGGVELLKAWTRPDTVGGWNSAAGLPKSSEVAAAPASTFLFSSDTELDISVLSRGIGLRRQDGLGWVEVATQPWRPTAQLAKGQEQVSAPDLERVVKAIAELRDSTEFRRRVIGWLRAAHTPNSVPPSQWDRLSAEHREAAEKALEVEDEQRRMLVIWLEAEDWRERK